MQPSRGRFRDACDLAEATGLYLRRSGRMRISTAALFEMALKVLQRAGLAEAAEILEMHHLHRKARRQATVLYHGPGKITFWQKAWLCEQIRRIWQLSPTTARVLAGHVERDLLAGGREMLTRQQVLEAANACVAGFGLADAQPPHPQPADS